MVNEYLIKQTAKMFSEIVVKLINPSFKTPKGGQTNTVIKNAFSYLEKRYGNLSRSRIVDYVVFATFKFRTQPRGCTIKAAFSETTLKQYTTDKGRVYYEDKWLAEENITRASLLSCIMDRSQHPKAKYIHIPSEERAKARLLNQHAGYLICQNSTLGWSPESASCEVCNYIEQCKEETQRKYPEIYRLRVEYGNKE